jgi:hypothetical protein
MIALVQHKRAVPATGDPMAALAYDSDNAAGNLLTAEISFGSTAVTVSGITDSQGNTWSLVKRQTYSGSFPRTVEIWSAPNCAAGANSVTVDLSASTMAALWIQEWSGADAAGATDGTNGANNASTTTHSAGGVTTTVADCLVLAAWCLAGGYVGITAPADYTPVGAVDGNMRSGVFYRVVSGTATENPAMTTASAVYSAGAMVAFQPGGSPPAAPPSRAHALLMMGVG